MCGRSGDVLGHIGGTPAFFLNGRRLQLPQDPKNPTNPYVQIIDIVKREL